MKRARSIAYQLEMLVGDLDWGRILRYFGLTQYRLRKSGTIIAHCLWHREKTPSLVFYPKESRGYGFSCMGCGEGGWRFYFILTMAMLKEEKCKVVQEDFGSTEWYRRREIFDRAHAMCFELHLAKNTYGWPTGKKGYRRARRKLIALVRAIRQESAQREHVQIEQPRGHRGRHRFSRHARRRRNCKLL